MLLTSLQVYSLQQIVATYKSLTNEWAHCSPANQYMRYCTFLHLYKKNILQHYLAFIALLLMEL